MQWTETKPTKNGFYWLRNYRIEPDSGRDRDPVVVWVYSSFGEDPGVSFVGNDSCFGTSFIEGEWFGPIQPPEDNKQ